jgi:DNA-3-methyladenine glycosylase
MKLKKSFYLRDDVVQIAKDLLGKYLFTEFDGKLTGGIITETEAYAGVIDKASHAHGGRRTARTEIMYAEGGTAYVYLCYGIHSLFNVVTNKKDVPHAILIRALHPTHGIETILKRRKINVLNNKISAGPGTVSQALGIHYSHTGINLQGDKIWIEDRKVVVDKKKIIVGKRVGVEYSGEHAEWPFRFILKEVNIS